jgi:predicted acetyltransferase
MDWDNMTANVDNRIMCCKNSGRIEGYMIFTFKRVGDTSMLKNNMAVSEMLYENSEALQEMLYFFHTQDDQIYRIVINLPDEDFHYLCADPRDDSDNMFAPVYHETNLQGVGLMYRVVNTRKLFELLHDNNFGNQDLKLTLNISDFSSLIMGAVGFKSLLRYGIAKISDNQYTDKVHQLFLTEEKPMCLVAF